METTIRATTGQTVERAERDRKSTRLNSSHDQISYAVFCLKKTEQRDHDQCEGHPCKLVRADVDLQDEPEDDDPEGLGQSDQGLAKYFPEDDGVAGDWRNEDLLAEILLPIREERDEPERRRLPHGLREAAGEDVVEQVEAAGAVAEPRLETRAEDADEDERKREVGHHALAVAQQLDEVAVRESQDGRGFTHSCGSRSRDTRPRGSAWESSRRSAGSRCCGESRGRW